MSWTNSYSLEQTGAFLKQVRKEKGCEDVAIIHSSVSPILGSHVGPGMVALVFWGTDRIARKVKRGGSAQ